MVTKIKMLGLMLVAAVALSSPMMVYADNGGGDKDSWHQDQKDRLFAKILDLSDDQVKQLQDSRKKQKDAMKSIFEQIKMDREAFNAQIVKATPDMNKINDIQTQIKTLQSQIVDNHLNSMLEIKKILTVEQFAGYMALEKERELMGHMMGHDKFGHRDEFGKNGDGREHWGAKGKDGDEGDRE